MKINELLGEAFSSFNLAEEIWRVCFVFKRSRLGISNWNLNLQGGYPL
jgi:hypothetical protein